MKALPKYGSHSAVPMDSSWKPLLEEAALEVFQMMANARLEANPSPVGNRAGVTPRWWAWPGPFVE